MVTRAPGRGYDRSVPLPEILAADPRRYFWDTDPDGVDVDRHADYVIERVLDHGDLRAVRWALAFYGEDRIRQWFLAGRARGLLRRTREFWRLVLGLAEEELCTAESSRPVKSRLWPH
jgi:hypothetical protein